MTLSGCSSSSAQQRAEHWSNSNELAKYWHENKIKVGDILIKNKTLNPMEWLGHSGVVVTEDSIADFPQPFVGYRELFYYNWLYEENREVIVLRYPLFTEEFKKNFLKNVEELKSQKYWITPSMTSSEYTYCSKYVWYLYWKTAKDMGYELDIGDNSIFFVFPYDILESQKLERLQITTL